MIKVVNLSPDVKYIGDSRVLHMMSDILVELLKSVLLTCNKTAMPSLKHLDYLFLAQSLGIV